MKANDIERFGIAMGKLCVAFHRQADKALLEVYREVLADRRIEDIEAAVAGILASDGEFMPPPGVVRKAALKAAAKRHGVAFIEGTGWVSLDGNPERAEHPDALDAAEDRKRIEAAKPRPRLGAVK